ncbi:MAG: VOC family protein [Solobacterium sp.]|nr:VOC family protein [Solobacterium sp.]
MEFNALIPELSVRDIEKSKQFYLEVLQFRIEYGRPEDRFVFLAREDNQLMLEEINGHWETGELVYPFGRGVNFEMTVTGVEDLYQRVLSAGIRPFRELKTNRYRMGEEEIVQKEFLVQDPDGYLLRFTD